ncbi:hypothetical protein [Nitrosococcus wardiae]|uniref:Uncharacterized protein n=1 Tax=Nitrosococcus wardiae TaxID=1814290 RepID=A0A4P7BZS7_9GAMM|nr:hypothetical protein [Nitrosococcus wardiae]QBQ55753.1 hypothetical protein E3U44_15460 [Nitrosococcus wardiae]
MVTEKIKGDSLFSLIIGPLIWMVHFLTLYLTTALACAKGFFHLQVLGLGIVPWVAIVATGVASGLILDSAIVAFRRWRNPPQEPGEKPPPPAQEQIIARGRQRALAFVRQRFHRSQPLPQVETAAIPMPPYDQANPQSRRRFLTYAGLLLSGLALIATLWEALPVLFMTSCR